MLHFNKPLYLTGVVALPLCAAALFLLLFMDRVALIFASMLSALLAAIQLTL